MTPVLRTSAYAVDRDGSTHGITEAGDFELSGEIASWMGVIASWMTAGEDVLARAATLDPARAQHVRHVYRVMHEVGMIGNATQPGEIRFLGDAGELAAAVARSGRPVPAATLACGPLAGSWLLDEIDFLAGGDEPVGAVLTERATALVIGPLPASTLRAMIVSLQARRSTGDEDCVDPGVVRTATAQLVRRATIGGVEPWRGSTVTPSGTRRWRLTPHPWVAPDAGAGTGSFDERVMAIVDPEHGAIREIGEFDLPQVPRHLTRVQVALDATVVPGDLWVIADGSDYEEARRRAVLRALAVRAETTIDPRRVFDGDGTLLAPARGSVGELAEALGRLSSSPEGYFVLGRRLSGDASVPVPVSVAFRCGQAPAPAPAAAVAESRGQALERALLEIVESDALAGAGGEAGSIQASRLDDAGLPDDLQLALAQLRSTDEHAWLGSVPSNGVPTVVAVTGRGAALACGLDHHAAAARALGAATVAEQLRLAGRDQPAPGPFLASAIPAEPAGRPVSLPDHPPVDVNVLVAAVLARHPDAVLVDLDHDPNLARLGTTALKVVTRS
jgi:hypothetical protein